MMATWHQFVRLLLVCAISTVELSSAILFAASVEEIALMKSPNREKILIEGARRKAR